MCENHVLRSAGILVLCLGLSTSSWSQDRGSLKERYYFGLKLMGADRYEEAVEAFQQMIAAHSNFGDAYKGLAKAFVFMGDHSGARETFGRLLDVNPGNPYAHYGMAQIELKEERFERAVDHLKQTLALDPSFLPAYGHDGGLAQVYAAMNDVESSILFFQELLARDAGNAYAHFGLGCSYRDRYDWDDALASFDEALRLDPELTWAYREKVVVYGFSGRFRKALETSNTLLTLASRRNEPEMVAYAKFAQSSAQFYLGDYWHALDLLNEALAIAEEIDDQQRVGAALNNLANIYTLMGDHRKALEFLIAGGERAKKTGDRLGEFYALNNIGSNHLERGDIQRALSYLEKALELARTNRLRNEEGYALINLAVAYDLQGERDRAFDALYEALSISRAVGDNSLTGAILSDLGKLKTTEGRYREARDYLEEALEVATRIEDVEIIWRARGELGLLDEAQGDSTSAIAHFAETIALYDEARRKLGIESMEVHFLDSNDRVFPSMIRLLAETGRTEEAFHYAEKFKAASLVRLLAEAQGIIQALLPEDVRSRLKEVSDELGAVHAELSREQSKPTRSGETILAMERRITDLEVRQEALIEEVRQEYPSFYRLTRSELLDVDEIRSRHLGPNQTLVEYIVGEETLSIFLLSREELVYRAVSVSREELERRLAELSPLFQKDKPWDEASRRQVLSPQLADFSIPPARELYDLLIGPVEPWLAEGTQLIIVPDDVLSYLPYEILVRDASDARNLYDFANARFLLESYPVSYAASASLLDPGLRRPVQASRGVLALGNPDFTRREGDRLSADYLASVMTYSGGVFRGEDLLPLPSAEAEVAAIGRTFPDSRVYVGPRASERAFKEEASEYRVLHLATHFLSDDRQPLYSKVLLAQDESASEDGYLQTYEIFNTRLNADLVVLSACNTGLGKLSRGEGLVGVSRAFLYAGVPSLVVSLWSVDDAATAILMESFYEHLREGASKRQALRQAKLDYLEGAAAGKRDPFYWAPFILIGDGSSIDVPDDEPRGLPGLPYWIAAFIVIVLIVATRAWQRRASGGTVA